MNNIDKNANTASVVNATSVAFPTPEQIKAVKARGFLHNRGTRQFSGRIITQNGMLTANQMLNLSEAANRFGNGTIAFTVRLTAELPGIDFDNIDAFCDFVAKDNMETGGTGARVRPIVACKGTTCVFGLCDTQGIAKEIHERFYEGYYDVVLPHKFKIAVGGCPNNCAKPNLNDIGIVGQRVPSFNIDVCRGCKKCSVVEACPMKAVSLVDGKLSQDKSICNSCGRCVKKCPFKVSDTSTDMFKIYIGGRWGKKIRIGTPINTLFNKHDALNVIEKSLLLFKKEGRQGERFSDTIERIGVENACNQLIADDTAM